MTYLRWSAVSPPLLILLALLVPSVPVVAGGPARVTVRRVDIVENLRNYHFDKLNAQLTALEQKAESDPATEMNAINAFNAFYTDQHLARSRIEDWVHSSPDSYAAAVANATALVEQAFNWQEFGGNPAADDRYVQWWAAKSAAESERALGINPDGIFAYAARIRVARIARNRADFERFKAQALAHQPQSFAIREQIMYGMLLKWGGSSQEIQDFAASSQQFSNRNPAIRFLNAWPLIDAGDALRDRGDLAGAIAMYSKGLQAGGEYWRAYQRRGFTYWSMGQPKQAVHDALRANQLFPDDTDVLTLLAYSTSELHNPEAAILWASECLRFDEPSSGMYRLIDTENKELKAQGKASW